MVGHYSKIEVAVQKDGPLFGGLETYNCQQQWQEKPNHRLRFLCYIVCSSGDAKKKALVVKGKKTVPILGIK